MTSLLLLCIAAAAVLCFGLSLLTGAFLACARQKLDALASAAQARVLLLLAFLPAAATCALMLAALAPLFGWIADHCGLGGDPHSHPHICADHHITDLPALPLILLASLLVVRFTSALFSAARAGIRAVTLGRAFRLGAATTRFFGALVLPLDVPQAFVMGLLRPDVYVTRGLLNAPYREHAEAVLAHERAHVERRDPLRYFVAQVALAFHLPGIAAAIARRLARAHEMAADHAAATSLGGGERVALALVHVARAQLAQPAHALAFAGSDLEARVQRLLEGEQPDSFRASTLLLISAPLLPLIAVSADTIHHAVELLLGIFGG